MGKVTRRAFLGGAAAAAVALPVSRGIDTTTTLELVNQRIPIRDLPPPFEGYRIGVLADLHIGVNVSFDLIDAALELLRSARPDLLLLGGDLIAVNDSTFARLIRKNRNQDLRDMPSVIHPQIAYAGLASRLADWSPKDGAYSVLGNHDRWVSPDLCLGVLQSLGHRVLVNELVVIRRGESSLQLYGTDDFWNGIPHLKGLPPPSHTGRNVRVLLNHNPDFTGLIHDTNAAHFDLAIHGHTHGGQIKLPGLGAISYNIKDLRLAEGLFTFPDGSQSYTSRGIGVVELPYRINCPPEVTLLELTRA